MLNNDLKGKLVPPAVSGTSARSLSLKLAAPLWGAAGSKCLALTEVDQSRPASSQNAENSPDWTLSTSALPSGIRPAHENCADKRASQSARDPRACTTC